MADLQQPGPATEPAAPAPPAGERSTRSALLIVFLVVIIDLFGFGIVLPLLPRYAQEFIAGGALNPAAGPRLAALVASFAAMPVPVAPWGARITGRIRRPP